MPIHRTRGGQEPSGGAEPGRSIVQIGDIFVEYTGQIPTQADLDIYNTPPVLPLDAEELYDILATKGILLPQDRPRPKKVK